MVDINKIMEQIDLSKLFKGAVADGSFTTPVQSNLKEFTPKNMLSGAVAGNPWGSDGSQNMTSKPNLDLINSSYNPQKNQSTPYSPEMYKPQAPVTQAQVAPKPVTFQPSEVPVVNNVMEQIDINKLTKSSPYGDTPIAPEQPLSFWDKTANFLGSPTGRSLGAGLLTSGLVGLSGGSGLEALSYGSQAGGTATNVYREQMNKDKKRQQEDNYFKMKIEQDKADREARQLETDKKIANDWAMADYQNKQNLDKMYKQNEDAYNRTLQIEEAKNTAEFEKGARAVERMRPSVEASLQRAKEALSSGNGLGPLGGKLVALGLNPNAKAGDNYADIESANAQMNALQRQKLQETGLKSSEVNSAMEANAYRYTIKPTDAEAIVSRKINNFENDYFNTNSVVKSSAMPQVGGIVDGYRYIGGNLNDANSWEKI